MNTSSTLNLFHVPKEQGILEASIQPRTSCRKRKDSFRDADYIDSVANQRDLYGRAGS